MGNAKILIDGVKISNLKQINDSRGAVLHMLRNDSEDFISFGECYFSEIFPSAIKAWKRHSKQIQNIAVPIGKIKLVMYDNRIGSLTEGSLMELELSRPDSYLRITIPANIWYGFKCISEIPALIINCANIPYDPEDSETIDFQNNSIPYTWSNYSK